MTDHEDAGGSEASTDDSETGDAEEMSIEEIGPGPVLLFDGVCNLCNGLIQFLIPRDPAGRLRYAPLQSPAGVALREEAGLGTDDLESVVLVEDGRVYEKSSAVLRVADLLGWPYRIAKLGWIVPRIVRDWCYDFVANRRYDWFGKKDQCMIPDEDVSDRFLG